MKTPIDVYKLYKEEHDSRALEYLHRLEALDLSGKEPEDLKFSMRHPTYATYSCVVVTSMICRLLNT